MSEANHTTVTDANNGEGFDFAPVISLVSIGVVVVIWLLTIGLVDPRGDFPLNDDWSYGWSVQQSMLSGRLVLSDWTSMPLLTHLLWGVGMSQLFGFSFTSLRFSTLILGGIAAIFTYLLLSEVPSSRVTRLIGVLVIAVNPIFLNLSFTFMTDVPFLTSAVISSYFFMRGLRQNTIQDLTIGTFFACWATLNRQLGLVLPVAFAAAYLYAYGFSRRSALTSLSPLIVTAGTLLVYQALLDASHILPQAYYVSSERLHATFAAGLVQASLHVGHRLLISIVYLGLFLLPFLAVIAPTLWKRLSGGQRLRIALTVLGFSASIMILLLAKSSIMPMTGNVIYDLGLGPPTLSDVYWEELDHLPRAPKMLWLSATAFGLIGAACLLLCYGRAVLCVCTRDSRERYLSSLMVFCITITGVYLLLLALTDLFDRYLVFLLPFQVLLLAALVGRLPTKVSAWSYGLSILMLLVFWLFGVGATHDYLSWNRARWLAIDYIASEHRASPEQIDGGFEYNWWSQQVSSGGDGTGERDSIDFVVSFGIVPGYSVDATFPYKRYMPRGTGYIYSLSKAVQTDN